MAVFPHPERLFHSGADFAALEEEVWQFQLRHQPVVRRFVSYLGEKGPVFLPISFFKDFEMKTEGNWQPAAVFGSSGTTGQQPSRHFARDLGIYEASLMAGYRHFYSSEPRKILALLPNYLERQDSSLVYMVRHWMAEFGLPGSGFFLYDHYALDQALAEAEEQREPVLLIGVSYALLDFGESHPRSLPEGSVLMETGGMKGRKKEMVRAELHGHLRQMFGVTAVHSEYGMTELLSQAYSLGDGRFRCPPWMRVVVTDPHVPGKLVPPGRSGRINVVDLANVYSCAFIRTDDLGRSHEDGSFEVLGRLDHAEIRGCNLMVSDL